MSPNDETIEQIRARLARDVTTAAAASAAAEKERRSQTAQAENTARARANSDHKRVVDAIQGIYDDFNRQAKGENYSLKITNNGTGLHLSRGGSTHLGDRQVVIQAGLKDGMVSLNSSRKNYILEHRDGDDRGAGSRNVKLWGIENSEDNLTPSEAVYKLKEAMAIGIDNPNAPAYKRRITRAHLAFFAAVALFGLAESCYVDADKSTPTGDVMPELFPGRR